MAHANDGWARDGALNEDIAHAIAHGRREEREQKARTRAARAEYPTRSVEVTMTDGTKVRATVCSARLRPWQGTGRHYLPESMRVRPKVSLYECAERAQALASGEPKRKAKAGTGPTAASPDMARPGDETLQRLVQASLTGRSVAEFFGIR